jgi:hypothetical protein
MCEEVEAWSVSPRDFVLFQVFEDADDLLLVV